MNNSRYKILSAFLAITSIGLFLSILFFYNSRTCPVCPVTVAPSISTENTKGTFDDGYKSGLDYAKKRLADVGFGGMAKTLPYNLKAIVLEKDSDRIKVEFDLSALDIFSEGKATQWVTIGDKTTLEKWIKPTQTENSPIHGKPLKSPESYLTNQIIQLSDLTVGGTITLSTSGDMLGKDPVLADKITVF
jgi:hypothetical protein